MNMLRRFWKDERGTESVEWAIIMGIIAVAVVTAATTIGLFVQGRFTALAGSLP